MKSRKKQVSLVAHVTVRGLESLSRGQIDLTDPRLDGSLGTVLMELHADPETAEEMLAAVEMAQEILGHEGSLHFMDQVFIEPWRVIVALVTTGNADVDAFTQQQAALQGHDLKVATSQN